MDPSFIINTFYDSIGRWFADHGARLILIFVLAAVADALVKAALSRKNVLPVLDNIPQPKYKNIIGELQKRRIRTVLKALRSFLSFLIWGIAAVTALPEFGLNLAPILAGLGLAGLAVGMAAKDLLTDFISGMFIIIEGEYNIGDKVEVAGVTGEVLAISLRRTILRGKNGAIHIVPNREIKSIKRFAGRKTSKVETKLLKNNFKI